MKVRITGSTPRNRVLTRSRRMSLVMKKLNCMAVLIDVTKPSSPPTISSALSCCKGGRGSHGSSPQSTTVSLCGKKAWANRKSGPLNG
jgi:hypothetical protein